MDNKLLRKLHDGILQQQFAQCKGDIKILNNIKNELHQRLNELFAETAIDELSSDMNSYKNKLSRIVQIADLLGVDTEFSVVTVNLKNELRKTKNK